MDKLIEVSNELFNEFDESSDCYWSKTSINDFNEAVGIINERFIKYKDKILEHRKFPPGIPVTEQYVKISNRLNKMKTDPLIPKKIRTKLIDLLEKRVEVMGKAYHTVLEEYTKDLSNNKHTDNLEYNKNWLWNKVNDILYKQGCGISQIEESVHEIRLSIQSYFETFDPFK
jgi:hypothetical protein